jgi:hypothetical protein
VIRGNVVLNTLSARSTSTLLRDQICINSSSSRQVLRPSRTVPRDRLQFLLYAIERAVCLNWIYYSWSTDVHALWSMRQELVVAVFVLCLLRATPTPEASASEPRRRGCASTLASVVLEAAAPRRIVDCLACSLLGRVLHCSSHQIERGWEQLNLCTVPCSHWMGGSVDGAQPLLQISCLDDCMRIACGTISTLIRFSSRQRRRAVDIFFYKKKVTGYWPARLVFCRPFRHTKKNLHATSLHAPCSVQKGKKVTTKRTTSPKTRCCWCIIQLWCNFNLYTCSCYLFYLFLVANNK